MKTVCLAAGLAGLVAPAVVAQALPDSLPALIEEARTLSREAGDQVWPGFASAPDTLLLIDGETEFLLCHEGPAGGFTPLDDDPVTGCSLASRTRVFPPGLLASFPAVDGVPSIVVGTPAATGRSPDDWMVTLVHEHMHQMQDARPGQFARVQALALDGGDETGMWMLNYPFPYDQPDTAAAARALADQALSVLAAEDAPSRRAATRTYLDRRAAFLASVSAADRRYYEFQVWKEGVARWTELAVTRTAAATSHHHARLAARQADRLIRDLEQVNLAERGRVDFYALGSAEAEILERLDPAWRLSYWDNAFDMGAIFSLILAEDGPVASSD